MANKEPVKALLQVAGPREWKDWLFQLQTSLISYGYAESLTEEGRKEFAGNMQGLHDFFGAVNSEGKR